MLVAYINLRGEISIEVRIKLQILNGITLQKAYEYERYQTNNRLTGRRRPARGSLKQNVKWTTALALPMKAVQLTIGLWIVGASWAFQLGPRRVHVRRNYRHPFSAAANNNALEGIGAPSNPGWESGRLNRLTEWADSSAPNRPIICEYDPKGRWLWRKWRGTLSITWITSMS